MLGDQRGYGKGSNTAQALGTVMWNICVLVLPVPSFRATAPWAQALQQGAPFTAMARGPLPITHPLGIGRHPFVVLAAQSIFASKHQCFRDPLAPDTVSSPFARTHLQPCEPSD